MPILHCHIPVFPLALLARAHPEAMAGPLALLDDEERIVAATPTACGAGVRSGQTPRQARIACPALHLQPADLPAARLEFEHLLAALDDYADAVEPASLGRAYLAAPDLDARTAIPFCQEIGRRLRKEFGQALQPAIGCDEGKFTASAAAQRTRPGTVRVVLGDAEAPFLRPLPVHLLPLPVEHQQWLTYLGIRTLGQFADLPSKAVFQQFGPPGRLAHFWAQGHDTRPVLPRHKRPTLTRTVQFEPALNSLPALMAAAGRLLAGLGKRLRDHLQAAQGVEADCQLEYGPDHIEVLRLSTPTSDEDYLLRLLGGRWEGGLWPGPAGRGLLAGDHWQAPISGLTVTLSDIQEAPDSQLILFPGAGLPADLLAEVVAHLRVRYGPGRLLRASVPNPVALRVEQRVRWGEYAA